MKKTTKMSTRRSQGAGLREMNHSLRLELQREQMERLEQQRIDFERRAHQARNNLYGLGAATATARGWIDSSRR